MDMFLYQNVYTWAKVLFYYLNKVFPLLNLI